ncbi:MAG: hypothetical protein KAJ73_05605 [Zetaproteobacteria bacterium]|nr:hypothetical protein [Zetaproteobacteria bacterium]
MSKKKRGFWGLVRDMKKWDDLDRDERDSVTVGVMAGFGVGLLVAFLPMCCVGAIWLAAVTQ